MKTKKEIQKLRISGWEMIDPSCNQMRKTIIEDQIYAFREDRCIDHITKESVVFAKELNYDNYSWAELINSCETFGYTAKQVDKWITEGEEIALMLECIFELTV